MQGQGVQVQRVQEQCAGAGRREGSPASNASEKVVTSGWKLRNAEASRHSVGNQSRKREQQVTRVGETMVETWGRGGEKPPKPVCKGQSRRFHTARTPTWGPTTPSLLAPHTHGCGQWKVGAVKPPHVLKCPRPHTPPHRLPLAPRQSGVGQSCVRASPRPGRASPAPGGTSHGEQEVSASWHPAARVPPDPHPGSS